MPQDRRANDGEILTQYKVMGNGHVAIQIPGFRPIEYRLDGNQNYDMRQGVVDEPAGVTLLMPGQRRVTPGGNIVSNPNLNHPAISWLDPEGHRQVLVLMPQLHEGISRTDRGGLNHHLAFRMDQGRLKFDESDILMLQSAREVIVYNNDDRMGHIREPQSRPLAVRVDMTDDCPNHRGGR